MNPPFRRGLIFAVGSPSSFSDLPQRMLQPLHPAATFLLMLLLKPILFAVRWPTGLYAATTAAPRDEHPTTAPTQSVSARQTQWRRPSGMLERFSNLRRVARLTAAAAIGFAAPSAHALDLTQGSTSEIPGVKTAPIAITNDDAGVTYSSLKFDSQLANLLWSAYGVASLYDNDFSLFTSSGDFGFNISSGSQVQKGWNASVNSDGTISLTNVGGTPILNFDPFDTGKTMTGNYFFNKDLLDADNDGNPNYTFHLLSEASGMPNFSSPLTLTGILGGGLDSGAMLEAYFGIDIFTAPGEAYALVPTDDHPLIPEPNFVSLLLIVAVATLARRHAIRA